MEISPLSDNAIAIIAKNGNNTAVMRKPVMAGPKCSPDSNPKIGGKIKFPAPKNKENNIKPEKSTFFLLISIPLNLYYTKIINFQNNSNPRKVMYDVYFLDFSHSLLLSNYITFL